MSQQPSRRSERVQGKMAVGGVAGSSASGSAPAPSPSKLGKRKQATSPAASSSSKPKGARRGTAHIPAVAPEGPGMTHYPITSPLLGRQEALEFFRLEKKPRYVWHRSMLDSTNGRSTQEQWRPYRHSMIYHLLPKDAPLKNMPDFTWSCDTCEWIPYRHADTTINVATPYRYPSRLVRVVPPQGQRLNGSWTSPKVRGIPAVVSRGGGLHTV